MTSLTPQHVQDKLKEVKYPGFSRDIVSFGLVKDVQVQGDKVHIRIVHTIDDAGNIERVRRDVHSTVSSMSGVEVVDIVMEKKGAASATGQGAGAAQHSHGPAQQGPKGIPGVKHIVAVASAKGGVGKSTVATNLALSLSQSGLKIGLMDADIYGPSIPTMLGVQDKPEISDDRRIHPVEKDGLKLISVGFLVPPEKAMIWRGPMVMGAVQQFLNDCEWGELDVLVVDLPPGTGDAQLTLVQQVPLSGVVIVTTPQEVALIDVVRGIQMFETTNAPIIGVIENMSGYICSSCGHEEDIFGKGGGKRTSERYGVPFLGNIPIDPKVRVCGDSGRPVVITHPESIPAQAFQSVADGVLRFLQSKEAGAKA